eukprot:211227-Alexandrium_andersonii.AAC.1
MDRASSLVRCRTRWLAQVGPSRVGSVAMVSPSLVGSPVPGARIVNYYEDQGVHPHPNTGEPL